MKKIAVDAMGGDYAPQAIVEGVNQALADFSDIEIQLYGDESKIKQYLTATDRVSIIHTDEKIDSDDEPTKAIRKKKNASMVLAANTILAFFFLRIAFVGSSSEFIFSSVWIMLTRS